MGRKKPFLPITWDERRMASVVPPSFAAQNRALVFPITGDDPSAHFLAAAPGRTPQRLTDRLAAGDRSSLGQAFSAELPVQSILTLHLYHIPPELARENCKKTQKGRTRRVRPRLSKRPRRVRGPQAANSVPSIFRGGMYVAKNTLRGESVFVGACAHGRAGRSEIPFVKKGRRPFLTSSRGADAVRSSYCSNSSYVTPRASRMPRSCVA